MERVALSVAVPAGQEPRVARLLARAGDSEGTVPGRGKTRTVATFTAPGRVLHITDAAGGLDDVVHAITAAPGVTDGLRASGAVPERSSPAAVVIRSRLTRWAHYALPYDGPHPVRRRALLYPVRTGFGQELRRVLAAGVAPGTPQRLASALISSTVFAAGDTVVRYWEATASAAEELANISRVVPYSGLGAKLNKLLDFPQDLTTESGFQAFFTGCAMTRLDGADLPAQP